jgi:hypothetical protein
MLTFVLFLLFAKRNARSRGSEPRSLSASLWWRPTWLLRRSGWRTTWPGNFEVWNVGVSKEPRTTDRSTCLEVTIPSQKDVKPRFAELVATLAPLKYSVSGLRNGENGKTLSLRASILLLRPDRFCRIGFGAGAGASGLECLVPPHQNVAHSAAFSTAHADASEETGVSVT